MKILQLHNRYQIRGGEDGVREAEQALLEQYGHQVEVLEVTNDEIVGPIAKGLTAVRAIYSWPAKRRVTATIQQLQPDIVHVHNFFPLLSPSIYDSCRSQQVPIVQTLHNYRLACVKAMLFRENQVCEACLEQDNPWLGVKHGCYRDSPAQSAVVAAMLTTHQRRKTWNTKVDAFITLTNFQRQKLVQAGLPADRIHIKPNFLASPATATSPAATPEAFVLFVGRLSVEKGLAIAIQAYQHNRQLPPLKVIGDGPERAALEQQVQQAGLTAQIEFLGYQPKETVLALMQQAIALVFPSIWYEGFPLTIVEAFGCGLPPIVSGLGSMAEIVQHQENGLHFTPNDPASLAEQIQAIATQPKQQTAFAAAARQTYEQLYTPDQNYAQLMAIYDRVMNPVTSI